MVSREGDATTAARCLSRKPSLRAAGLCTTLSAWTHEGPGLEGLLQRPLRASPTRGAPLPDGQVLHAAREGRGGGNLRTGGDARAPPGLGRGDPARPPEGLPPTRRWRNAHAEGDAEDRVPVVGEDGRALAEGLGRVSRSVSR